MAYGDNFKTFTITIYSSNGITPLYRETIEVGENAKYFLVEGGSFGDREAVIFRMDGGDNQGGSILGYYVFENSDVVGISTEPLDSVAMLYPAMFPCENIDFYVADGMYTEVLMRVGEYHESIIRIGLTQTAFLECADKIMPSNLLVIVPDKETSHYAIVADDSDNEIISIPQSKTGVIQCGGKRMPYNLKISFMQNEEEE